MDSLPCNSDPGSHSRLFSHLPPPVRALHFYPGKISVLPSLVDICVQLCIQDYTYTVIYRTNTRHSVFYLAFMPIRSHYLMAYTAEYSFFLVSDGNFVRKRREGRVLKPQPPRFSADCVRRTPAVTVGRFLQTDHSWKSFDRNRRGPTWGTRALYVASAHILYCHLVMRTSLK